MNEINPMGINWVGWTLLLMVIFYELLKLINPVQVMFVFIKYWLKLVKYNQRFLQNNSILSTHNLNIIFKTSGIIRDNFQIETKIFNSALNLSIRMIFFNGDELIVTDTSFLESETLFHFQFPIFALYFPLESPLFRVKQFIQINSS